MEENFAEALSAHLAEEDDPFDAVVAAMVEGPEDPEDPCRP